MFNLFTSSSSTQSPVEINMNEVFANVETGDILFFSNSSYISVFIKKCTFSDVSHVIIVLKNPSFLNLPDGYYGVEANPLETTDELLQKQTRNARIRKLEDILHDYASPLRLYHRRLHIDRDETFYNTLKETIIHLQDCPYDLNPINWVMSEYGDNYTAHFKEYNAMFCSAVCTYTYIKLGLVDENVIYIHITPSELSDDTITIKDNRLDPMYLIYRR